MAIRSPELFAMQPVAFGFQHFAIGYFPTFGCGQQSHDFFAFNPISTTSRRPFPIFLAVGLSLRIRMLPATDQTRAYQAILTQVPLRKPRVLALGCGLTAGITRPARPLSHHGAYAVFRQGSL
jgi:hypothetical protein